MSVVTTLTGCSLAEIYENPIFPFASGYAHANAGAPVLLDNVAWWKGLDDPTLDRLVDLALRDSLSISLARERILAARAQRDMLPGSTQLAPSSRLTASGTEIGRPDVAGTGTLGLAWMLDPYGARGERLRAAEAGIEIADAEIDAARLLVLFNVANVFVDLRNRQRLLTLSRSELRGRRETLALARTLVEAESATRLEIVRSEARVAEIEAQLPGLEAAVTTTLDEIAFLVGLQPGELPGNVAAGLSSGSQPIPGLSPDVGIPADLLRNRPDIRIAERRYYAAVARIGVARAALYPSLSLTGGITLDLLRSRAPVAEYFFGPAVQFPALPLDDTNATVELRHSEARQAHIAWKATVLDAILEVENALVTYNAAVLSTRSARDAVRLYEEALRLTRDVFAKSEATLGDLIDAEEAVSQAERTLADIRRTHALQFVALNVRLGAGHGEQDTPVPPPLN